MNQAARRDIEAVVRQIEKIETAVEASFQDHFVKAMAIRIKVIPYVNLAAAVDLPVRILTDEDAPALASGRRRGGRRSGILEFIGLSVSNLNFSILSSLGLQVCQLVIWQAVLRCFWPCAS